MVYAFGADHGARRERGIVGGNAKRDALRDALAALVLTQRATFATPVWLNAGLAERPLTSACFILKADDSIAELLEWNTREGLLSRSPSPLASSRLAIKHGMPMRTELAREPVDAEPLSAAGRDVALD